MHKKIIGFFFFIKNIHDVYKQHFVLHNVHAVLHLRDDYDLFVSHDNSSVFSLKIA